MGVLSSSQTGSPGGDVAMTSRAVTALAAGATQPLVAITNTADIGRRLATLRILAWVTLLRRICGGRTTAHVSPNLTIIGLSKEKNMAI